MQIQFSAARPDADFVVLPVEKDGLGRTAFGDLDTSAERVLLAAAKAGRFEGEAGAIVEAVVAAGEGVQRVALIGIGAGDADYERAGGALTRSEEHTSELQSLMRISYAVFCLKKKNQLKRTKVTTY